MLNIRDSIYKYILGFSIILSCANTNVNAQCNCHDYENPSDPSTIYFKVTDNGDHIFTSTGDIACTLRGALYSTSTSNGNPCYYTVSSGVKKRIRFAFPANATDAQRTIKLNSSLPYEYYIDIDGQHLNTGPQPIIDGQGKVPWIFSLYRDCIIKNLSITGAYNYGIMVSGVPNYMGSPCSPNIPLSSTNVLIENNTIWNIDSKNASFGAAIYIISTENVVVKGNKIGNDGTSNLTMGNYTRGVYISSPELYCKSFNSNHIIGTASSPNLIANCPDGAIFISNSNQNILQNNQVHSNSSYPASATNGKSIYLKDRNSNLQKTTPTIIKVEAMANGTTAIDGKSEPNDVIEVFTTNTEQETITSLGTVTADANGDWTHANTLTSTLPSGIFFIATARSSNKNTSELSEMYRCIAPVVRPLETVDICSAGNKSVEVRYNAYFSYQWYYKSPTGTTFSPITGATSSICQTTGTGSQGPGKYYVKVTFGNCEVESNEWTQP